MPPRKVDIEIVNPAPVPVYTDGEVQGQAHDRLGNQLMLPSGVRAWYWAPESLSQDVVKYYVSVDSLGRIDYTQIFDLQGDPLRFPVLVGLPKQPLWLKYKYCQRIEDVPVPEPEPEPAPVNVRRVRVVGVRFDDGIILDIEDVPGVI